HNSENKLYSVVAKHHVSEGNTRRLLRESEDDETPQRAFFASEEAHREPAESVVYFRSGIFLRRSIIDYEGEEQPNLRNRSKWKKEVICIENKKVMVIGAGQVGSGIGEVCAQAGFEVLLNDLNEQALEKGLNNIDKLLTRAVDKERITAKEKTDTLNRLKPSSHLKEAHDCDLVIEAAVENMDVKKKIFSDL